LPVSVLKGDFPRSEMRLVNPAPSGRIYAVTSRSLATPLNDVGPLVSESLVVVEAVEKKRDDAFAPPVPGEGLGKAREECVHFANDFGFV
jgi:hypothetical protein